MSLLILPEPAFNPDPALLTTTQQRALALSNVFLTGWLVQYLAAPDMSEQQHTFRHFAQTDAQRRILTGIFAEYEPSRLSSLAIYGRLEAHHPGLRAMAACIHPEALALEITKHPLWRRRQGLVLRHAIGLLQIERALYTRKARRQQLQDQLQQIQRRLIFFDGDIMNRAILAGLAQIYTDTAGQLRQRLRIQGQMQRLTQPDTIDLIRALLLGGVQAAHLWRELGGRPGDLTWRRRLLRQDLTHLLQLAQQRQLSIS